MGAEPHPASLAATRLPVADDLGRGNELTADTPSSSKGPCRVDKQKKTVPELEEIVKQRIRRRRFPGHHSPHPEAGWHATIYGRQPAEVHRCQVMADTIAAELCKHYELDE